MSDPEATFYEIGCGIAEAEASQMFGKTCFNAGKGCKPVVSFFHNCMVFTDHMNATSLNGARLFDPSGKVRAMREWVQVPYDHAALLPSFAQTAQRYVLSL